MFVPANLVLSTLLALIANKKRPFSKVFEVMYTMPMAVAMSSASLIFKIILNPTIGIVNRIIGANIGWFQDKEFALVGILILCVWMGFSFDFLLILAALRGVPRSLTEAAQIDGANAVQRFFYIQLPKISPTILYVVCTNIVLAAMTSGPILLITQGGPAKSTLTLIYTMYTAGYKAHNYSSASCISVIVVLLTFALVLASLRLERKRG